jgi:tetratricopeptide (TPR) repeat protein
VPIGPADDAWLTLAHTLARAEQVPARARAAVLAAGGDGVAALVPASGPASLRGALSAAVDGLRVLADRLAGSADAGPAGPAGPASPGGEPVYDAVGALQAAVAQQEEAGAFALAFGTLAALRAALAPVLDRRAEGLLLAQQGRVARQLGAMAAAAEFYAASVRAARAARAPDVAARALIGAGSLATVRGNYPEARGLFRRGLSAADKSGQGWLRRAGHHGLLVAAIAARDLETALAHGWAAFKEESSNGDHRAEALINLGEISLHAKQYRAALGACLSALELSDLPRLRLPAMGTGALAAAYLGEHRILDFFVTEAERLVGRSGQPFENARMLAELAEACFALGRADAAKHAERAATLADDGNFNEVAVRVERLRVDAAVAPRFAGVPHTHRSVMVRHSPIGARPPGSDAGPYATALRPRSPRARAVLRTLETLATAGLPERNRTPAY